MRSSERRRTASDRQSVTVLAKGAAGSGRLLATDRGESVSGQSVDRAGFHLRHRNLLELLPKHLARVQGTVATKPRVVKALMLWNPVVCSLQFKDFAANDAAPLVYYLWHLASLRFFPLPDVREYMRGFSVSHLEGNPLRIRPDDIGQGGIPACVCSHSERVRSQPLFDLCFNEFTEMFIRWEGLSVVGC